MRPWGRNHERCPAWLQRQEASPAGLECEESQHAENNRHLSRWSRGQEWGPEGLQMAGPFRNVLAKVSHIWNICAEFSQHLHCGTKEGKVAALTVWFQPRRKWKLSDNKQGHRVIRPRDGQNSAPHQESAGWSGFALRFFCGLSPGASLSWTLCWPQVLWNSIQNT